MHHSHHSDYVDVVSSKGPASLSSGTRTAFIAMAVIGFGVFFAEAFLLKGVKIGGAGIERMGWISFLHNFYFFTGLAAAGVVIAAIIQVTQAMWGRPIKRFAESTVAFLPFSLVCVILLYIGSDHIWEWSLYPPDDHLYHNKHTWLAKNFVFARVVGYIVILWLLAKRFTSLSDRADFGVANEKNPAWPQPSGWKGKEAEVEASQKGQSFVGVLYCFAYAICVSGLAYDMIMSLDFRWISTMFGGWNFTTFMLLGWGTMYMMTHWMSKRFGLEKYMSKPLYHDLGKLTFGFTIVWGYLFFAQLMVIWYGNLAHEAGYLITRIKVDPWSPIAWTVGGMVFLLPFILGLSKKRKMSPSTFAPVVFISFIGIWLERFILIAPASWYYDRLAGTYTGGIPWLMISDALIFCGFLGVFGLLYAGHLYKRPVMVISDPRLDLGINRH